MSNRTQKGIPGWYSMLSNKQAKEQLNWTSGIMRELKGSGCQVSVIEPILTTGLDDSFQQIQAEWEKDGALVQAEGERMSFEQLKERFEELSQEYKDGLFVFSPSSLSCFFEVGQDPERLSLVYAKLGSIAEQGGAILRLTPGKDVAVEDVLLMVGKEAGNDKDN